MELNNTGSQGQNPCFQGRDLSQNYRGLEIDCKIVFQDIRSGHPFRPSDVAVDPKFRAVHTKPEEIGVNWSSNKLQHNP